MRFSYNWLQELAGANEISPVELGRLITMKTAECEGVEPAGEHLLAVCAARVESVEPIPSSHNRVALVETGRYGRRTVVCGAPNCRPGMTTAYVPAGVNLGSKEIRKIAIEGVESDGMLASGAELGINRDHDGILDFLAEPGAPVPGCVPDSIIEIDNKSLTHRPDLWGHHGMAREVSAILNTKLHDPVKLERLPGVPAAIEVRIEDLELCPRYSALVFENVTVQPSPLWLQHRLETIGLNPINNIVDVTNYVMAELAQPMHAFDADKLNGGIIVRPARPGETLAALNGETYTLSPSNLVIADEKEAIALGGVIGGMDTAIGPETKRIVLESANFHASSIRKTSAKLRLRTDASMRFEKAQDPENTVRGLARAVGLLEDVSLGIRLVGGLADARSEPAPLPVIDLPIQWLWRKLGREVPEAEVRQILECLQFKIETPAPGLLRITVPSWRATKDITIKDDLVEEVGRMVGYASITPEAPKVAAAVPHPNPERKFHARVRTAIAAQGFTEVYNYSFVSEELAARFGFRPESHVQVANPISSDQGLMRMSLLPGIWRNLQDNSRHFSTFRLFEIGREIHKNSNGAPDEIPHVVAAVYGVEDGMFEMKRLAESLMPRAELLPASARSYEHPARVATVHWRGQELGRLFELHPSLVEQRAVILDIDLARMQPLAAVETRYQPLRRYPSSAFDLSVIAGRRELAGNIEKQLAIFAGDSLERIEFVRQYSGPPLPEDKKSVSFRITVSAGDHTLSADEIASIRARIIEGMERAGYSLRV
jgi:phenylalanyl-tRNA synthetase beta chain